MAKIQDARKRKEERKKEMLVTIDERVEKLSIKNKAIREQGVERLEIGTEELDEELETMSPTLKEGYHLNTRK